MRTERSCRTLAQPCTLAALALSLAVTVRASDAHAQRCPASSGVAPAVAELDARQRLEFIHRRLRHGSRRATIWASMWGSSYATIATVQGIRAATSDEFSTRWESVIAAGSATLGAAFVLVSPPTIIADRIRLDRRMARLARTDDPCATLAEAERMLARDAANQAFGIGPLMQTVTVAYNIGLGLVFGFWLHDWMAGGITIATGLALSELMIFTQPTDAIDAWRRYRIGDLRAGTPTSTSYWIVAPDISPDHVGLRVGGAM
jgi:hypothetical protein